MVQDQTDDSRGRPDHKEISSQALLFFKRVQERYEGPGGSFLLAQRAEPESLVTHHRLCIGHAEHGDFVASSEQFASENAERVYVTRKGRTRDGKVWHYAEQPAGLETGTKLRRRRSRREVLRFAETRMSDFMDRE
jgi:hypothetical protein